MLNNKTGDFQPAGEMWLFCVLSKARFAIPAPLLQLLPEETFVLPVAWDLGLCPVVAPLRK